MNQFTTAWRPMDLFLLVGLSSLASLVSNLLYSETAFAQIRTDSSLGQTAQTLAGPNYSIPQSLGKLAGNNLFHSFQTFNLASGEVANFTTSSLNIANVISRVTGGDASQINGTLRLSAAGGTPAFFFINPAGVTFGAGASVDVPGAFHVSTANDLRFADGRFRADLNQVSTFSTAAPEAFGFVGNTRTTLTIKDGVLLKPQKTHAISVVAGDVTIDSGGFGAAGGEVRAVAVGAGANDIALLGQVNAVDGNLRIVNGGFIAATNLGAVLAGPIVVRAGNITLDSGSQISTGSYANETGGAGSIDVLAAHDVNMDNGAFIQSLSGSLGNAAGIQIKAQNIKLDNAAYVYSAALNDTVANGANIKLSVTEGVSIDHGASVSTSAYAKGDAGTIQINAAKVAIANTGYVASDTFVPSTGGTGNIAIQATDSIAITEHGKVYVSTVASGSAGTVSLSAGDISLDTGANLASISFEGTATAGNIDVHADKSLKLNHDAAIISTSMSSGNAGAIKLFANDISFDGKSKVSSAAAAGTGNAGSVDVTANATLSLLDGSLIDSSTFSAGRGGTIKVTARDITVDKGSAISSLAIDGTGNAGSIDITSSNRLTLSNSGAIVLSTSTVGNAGSVKITGHDIDLNSGGLISVAAIADSGNAGDIVVAATGNFAVNDGFVSSSTLSTGRAGSIDINAATISLSGLHGRIDALAGDQSLGQTGNISLKASDFISLSDGGKLLMSNEATRNNTNGLTTTALTVSAPSIVLNGALISAVSDGNLPAGSINIDFSKQLLLNYSRIATSANDGNGGSISVQGGGLMSLNQSKINTSVTGISGNGGDIHIAADTLVMTTGFIQANTAANQAQGGLVNIDVKTLVASGDTLFVGGQSAYNFAPGIFGFNVIQAAAPTGVSGVILITNPVLDLSGSLGRLNAQLLDVAGLGRNPCQTTGGSSLAQAGRGGLPISYRGLLGAESMLLLPNTTSNTAGKMRATLTNSTNFVGLGKACL